MKVYALTKLLLDQSALASDYDDPDLYLPSGGELMQLPKGKSAKDVTTEYLKGMRKMFEDARDEKLGALKLEKLPIDFWITVPASWSEKAKLLTKTAAIDAGFGARPIDRVMLIPEPEAAAHYALKSNIHRLKGFVQVCSVFYYVVTASLCLQSCSPTLVSWYATAVAGQWRVCSSETGC